MFASGFAGFTDIKEGPDGLIYVVSVGDGTIYRIAPPIASDVYPVHI
jgi:hypothetical protein